MGTDLVLVPRGGRDVKVDRVAEPEPLRRTGAVSRDEVRGAVSIRRGEVLIEGRFTVEGLGRVTGVTERRIVGFRTGGFRVGVYFGVVVRRYDLEGVVVFSCLVLSATFLPIREKAAAIIAGRGKRRYLPVDSMCRS
jgi:hypothetical protein